MDHIRVGSIRLTHFFCLAVPSNNVLIFPTAHALTNIFALCHYFALRAPGNGPEMTRLSAGAQQTTTESFSSGLLADVIAFDKIELCGE